MPVHRYVSDPGTRMARARVRVTVEPGTSPGREEREALREGLSALAGSRLDELERIGREYMAARGWPVAPGEYYWTNNDGSRRAPAAADENRPPWATFLAWGHPAHRFPEGSPERDAWELLWYCGRLRHLMATGAPAAALVDQAIELGMVAGRAKFEARFGRATDVGIRRIRAGHIGGRANAEQNHAFRKERRLGALQRAIDASPQAGRSAWARAIAGEWPNSVSPEAAAGAARKFFDECRKHGLLRLRP
jgi:hypothetical protein